jgi:hypothetical protein
MPEALMVLAVVLLLVVAGTLAAALSWDAIVLLGAAVAVGGFLLGVPTGFYYHVKLHAFLSPRGQLPRGWWWSPVRYHRLLLDAERPRVMPWFYLGAAGFAVVILGSLVTALGVAMAP